MILTRKVQTWLKFVLGFSIGLLFASYLRKITLTDGGPLCSLQENLEKKIGLPIPLKNIMSPALNSTTKKLLFVGVMTAQKYIETRAQAIYRTWGQQVPGDIMFFSSESSQSKSDLPLVPLKGVDDSYPPQKKSFLMLKFIHDNFIDRYEWFMRADDDVYVRTDRLEKLLRSVNSSKPQFIGQAGMGNKEEFGQLSLDADENFCMGGPGIIFSKQTLKLMVPHIRYCLKHLYTTHEDVEIGRCVRKFAGIPCTWSYEMQTILYHNFTGETATSSRLRRKEINRAITLHPIKSPENMHRLHAYYYGMKSQDLRFRTLQLHRELLEVSTLLKEDPDELLGSFNLFVNTTLLGIKPSLNKHIPNHSKDIIQWDFFTKSFYSFRYKNPKMRLDSAFQTALDDVIMEVMENINKYSKQRGRVIEFKDVYYGYYRVHPLHGVDYILDLLLTYKKFRGKKMTVPVRRHAYLQRSFSALEIRQVPANLIDLSQKEIHFILPLFGRIETFQRFMSTFDTVCLSRLELVKLAVVVFLDGSQDQDATHAKDIISALRLKYPHSDLRLVEASGIFSRALALEIGAKLFPLEALLFFIDVDMIFDKSVLRRIRSNTIMGEQAYFPIVFSQYDPAYVPIKSYSMFANDSTVIHNDLGYWRQFGFGIASLYHIDLQNVGGMDTTIKGWGKEDVDLYSKLVRSNLNVFRAPDPGLIHIFHPITCDPSLEAMQFEMCLGSKSSSMGPVENLAKIILKNHEKYSLDYDLL